MSPNMSNITSANSLSISVSGTAYLQRSLAAGVKPGTLAASKDEVAASKGTETASQALAKVDAQTLETIEKALKAFNPDASLTGYTDDRSWSNGSGLILHLIA